MPIGGYFGKEAHVYGAYLLACYNPEEEIYQTVCKIGTGFSDEALQSLPRLDEHKIEGPRRYYSVPEGTNITPDVWFAPSQVWEVMAADLSISPVHTAAAGSSTTPRIALRFRALRVRDDKGPEDSTNAAQVAQMYNDQDVKNQKGGAKDFDDDDW